MQGEELIARSNFVVRWVGLNEKKESRGVYVPIETEEQQG